MAFYTVGGTVQAGDGVYIPRQADDELLALCKNGEFAYILLSRQVGKSSSMIHTAQRLADTGVLSVIIDLTNIGSKVTAEEWFFGILVLIESQLPLTTDAIGWWNKHAHLSTAQRFVQFFEQVVLAEIEEQLVVFVDEIDSTINLGFTDDFYAAIRFIYNGRAKNPDLKRLSFVLLGVATPTDLIADPARTPFNIGKRVELTDFKLDEALPLAKGFDLPPDAARQLMGWVLDWTGGHPYLTQRLCAALAEQKNLDWTKKQVDEVVKRMFLGKNSGADSNLALVRDRLTKTTPEQREMLLTYREIYQGDKVLDEERAIAKSGLKLAGVVRRQDGLLVVRNRIYRRVFDEEWIGHHLPPDWKAELRKQQLRRALIAAAVVLFCISIPTSIWALNNANAARNNANAAIQSAKNETTAKNLALKAAADAKKARRLAEASAMKATNSEKKEKLARLQAEVSAAAAREAARKENSAKQQAQRATLRAEKARQSAEEQSQIAQVQRALALRQSKIARTEKTEAERSRMDAVNARNSVLPLTLLDGAIGKLRQDSIFRPKSIKLAAKAYEAYYEAYQDPGIIAVRDVPNEVATFLRKNLTLMPQRIANTKLNEKLRADNGKVVLFYDASKQWSIAPKWLAASLKWSEGDVFFQLTDVQTGKSVLPPRKIATGAVPFEQGSISAINNASNFLFDLSPDGKYFAAQGRQSLRVWSTTVEAPLSQPKTFQYDGMVQDVLLSPDGRYLAALTREKTLQVWRTNDPAHSVVTATLKSNCHNKLQWDANDRLHAILFYDNRYGPPEAIYCEPETKTWDFGKTTQPQAQVSKDAKASGQTHWMSPDGNYRALLDYKQLLINVISTKNEAMAPIRVTVLPENLVFSPDNRLLAIVTGPLKTAYQVAVWNLANHRKPEMVSHIVQTDANSMLYKVAFDATGNTLALQFRDYEENLDRFEIWNVRPNPLPPSADIKILMAEVKKRLPDVKLLPEDYPTALEPLRERVPPETTATISSPSPVKPAAKPTITPGGSIKPSKPSPKAAAKNM